jgi:hypothetical protein
LVCMFMTSLIGEVVCAYHHAMTQKNLEWKPRKQFYQE